MKALRPFWRFEYAKTSHGSRGDPFRGLKNADATGAKKHLIVVNGKFGALILNRFPYAAGHLLAVPYRAVAELENLTPGESAELMDLVNIGKLLLKKVLKAEGTNIGINQGSFSGGSVPMHLHWHIVPRWRGDHNFLPVTAGIGLLIRSQESVWAEMVKIYKAIR